MGTTSVAPREQDAILPDASGFVRFYETTFTNVFSKKNDDDDKKESEEEEEKSSFAAILQPFETRRMVGVRRRRVLRRSEVL